MSQPIAIIIAGALIAVAILIVNHWTLTQDRLLNRWTGSVVYCEPTNTNPQWF
jgi:hypothetical protein